MDKHVQGVRTNQRAQELVVVTVGIVLVVAVFVVVIVGIVIVAVLVVGIGGERRKAMEHECCNKSPISRHTVNKSTFDMDRVVMIVILLCFLFLWRNEE
jgi:hypothetical protein